MLREERQLKILSYINSNEFAKVEELAKACDCSEITIRRDLDEMDKKNIIKKLHGGAKSLDSSRVDVDYAVTVRNLTNIDEKHIIAREGVRYIPNKSNIYLDAGSTVGAIIPLLKNLNVKVYTHGVHHLNELAMHGIPTEIIGGTLKFTTMASVGIKTAREICEYKFDVSFIGANAIDIAFGLSTPDQEEAEIKKSIISHSRRNYVLADKSKFDKVSYVKFADETSNIIIITNFVDADSDYGKYEIVHI